LQSMKIALVTYALNIGGMESFMFGLARRLRDFGMEATFVVTDSTGAWHENPLADGFRVLGVLPRKWQSRRRHAKRVAKALHDFDAVILNHSRAAQSAAGLLPDPTPVIAVLHNNTDDIYRVGLANPANIDCFVAVSEQVREQALMLDAPPEKTMFIRNGVEVFPEYPKIHGSSLPGRPLKVVFAGRIEHEQKGVLYLPGIIAGVRDKGAAATFFVIGDGADARELQARVAQQRLDGMVTFHGALPHSEAMRVLGEADVLIMPSHYEGQPVTLFEAMARGVVPLVSRLPGITDEVISEGRDGLLAPVGDEGAFVEQLVSLAADRERVAAMSRAAWRSALERFGIESMTGRYVALLEKCIKERRVGSASRKTGVLDLSLLGKRSQFPLFLHDAKRNWKSLFRDGRGAEKGVCHGN